ncbi:DUF5671 domain-containing protein [Lysobacter enzymogenes]|uniref:DUF5671 domain-containing protein n=1 Tax=Lysobacter enzymogenes TaxID=69 RepID=UPI00384DAD46
MAAGISALERFVHEALSNGHSRQATAQALIEAGWSEAQVRGALGAYADSGFALPVPKPRVSVSARETFVYLLTFSALYVVAFHLCDLWFDLIGFYLPDAIENNAYWSQRLDASLRWSVASLAVAFPLFAWLCHVIDADVRRNPGKRLSPVRRWLTYLTLFLAATALICDATALLYQWLGGELSLRFGLKALAVATVAGSAFCYYIRDLRREETQA